MTLREATSADLPALGQLVYQSIGQVAGRDYQPAQVAAWRAGFAASLEWGLRRLPTQYFLVAEEGGSLLGLATLTAAGEVDLLYVAAQHQRRGVGRALLAALEREARRRGLACLTAAVSLTARPLFERHGFALVAAQQATVRGVAMPNLRMEKLVE